MTGPEELSLLPLHDLHEKAGARFGPFAGWSMPITYPLGVLKEHLHTRAAAGLFDISHMRLFAVEGPQASAMISRACPLDAQGMETGRSRYSFLLTDTAGIIDDLIVTRLGPDRFMVVANAGNAARDEAHLRQVAAGFDCSVEPLDRVFLALQGPLAADALRAAGITEGDDLVFMQGCEPAPGWFLTRSGYTGEDGFEIACPPEEAVAFASRLLALPDVEWIGLAARDSLRLEAGLCLHGQDITDETTPVEAGLMWAIPKLLRETGGFIGADGLREAGAAGPARRRVGLKPQGRQPVRSGAILRDGDGAEIGVVTSGGFGPSAGHPVAMGYVARDLVSGASLFADVRGQSVPVDIHPLPFTPHRYRRG